MAFENILLIDDDEEDQEIFLMALQEVSPSIRCQCCGDAKEALELLDSGELQPDLIFLDLNMPMMNGQQFLARMQNNRKISGIPVIIFTTSSDPSTVQTSRESGVYDFITKPGNFDHLTELLKSIIL